MLESLDNQRAFLGGVVSAANRGSLAPSQRAVVVSFAELVIFYLSLEFHLRKRQKYLLICTKIRLPADLVVLPFVPYLDGC